MPETGPPNLVHTTLPTSYHELHWDSVNRIKDYLYRQLMPLLDDALERIETTDRGESGRMRPTLDVAASRLALARNALGAWASLIQVESGDLVAEAKRRPIAAAMLPTWLCEYLRGETTFVADYKRPVFVHPEVFYETLVLLCQIGEAAGALLHVTLADATEARRGVWLRAVFVPPVRGPYASMSGLLTALTAHDERGEAAFRVQVASSLLKINQSRLVLQNNRQTGEQALAAVLPTLTTDDLRLAHGDVDRYRSRLPAADRAAPAGPDRPTPFRLDKDTDETPPPLPSARVPAFSPGALASWLDVDPADLSPDDDEPKPPPPDPPYLDPLDNPSA